MVKNILKIIDQKYFQKHFEKNDRKYFEKITVKNGQKNLKN